MSKPSLQVPRVTDRPIIPSSRHHDSHTPSSQVRIQNDISRMKASSVIISSVRRARHTLHEASLPSLTTFLCALCMITSHWNRCLLWAWPWGPMSRQRERCRSRWTHKRAVPMAPKTFCLWFLWCVQSEITHPLHTIAHARVTSPSSIRIYASTLVCSGWVISDCTHHKNQRQKVTA